jgi:hypothetical protein
MYIHRIVIDANRINARGGIPAMNSLEHYHKLGLVELLITTTLPVEFRPAPSQLEKAKQYTPIGGSGLFYLTQGASPDAYPGTPIWSSRVTDIMQLVFGGTTFATEHARIRAQRDALHLDQAYQHGVDFFLTCDKRIRDAKTSLKAAGIQPQICTAEDCLSQVEEYFLRVYGTVETAQLSERMAQDHPILMGSNSFGQASFVDVSSGEAILGFKLDGGHIAPEANIRDQTGTLLITISSGQPFRFHASGATVNLEAGPSSLLLGHKTCRSFAISVGKEAVLAGIMLKSDRLLLHYAVLRNQLGSLAIRIDKEALECFGTAVKQ